MAASLIGFHGKGGIRDLRLLALEELGLFLSLLLLLLPHPNVPADSSTANSLLKQTTRQKVIHSNEHCARKKTLRNEFKSQILELTQAQSL